MGSTHSNVVRIEGPFLALPASQAGSLGPVALARENGRSGSELMLSATVRTLKGGVESGKF